jgi:hypothetical protein
MKQRSIVIAIAVLATKLLAGIFITSQIAYTDDSSETEINIEEKRKLT